MGWDGISDLTTKQEYVDHLLATKTSGRERFGENHFRDLVAHCFVERALGPGLERSHLWTVWKNFKDGKEESLEIILFVIKRAFGSLCFKEISEREEPSSLDCPLEFLDMVPIDTCPDDECTMFRRLVEAYWLGVAAASGEDPYEEDHESERQEEDNLVHLPGVIMKAGVFEALPKTELSIGYCMNKDINTAPTSEYQCVACQHLAIQKGNQEHIESTKKMLLQMEDARIQKDDIHPAGPLPNCPGFTPIEHKG